MPVGLFMSETCDHPNKLLSLLDKYWPTSGIQIVNVNRVPPENVPRYINSTPSIIVVNHETRESELYEGQDAFDWVRVTIVVMHGRSSEPLKHTETTRPVQPDDVNFNPAHQSGYARAEVKEDNRDLECSKDDIKAMYEARLAEYDKRNEEAAATGRIESRKQTLVPG